MAVFEAVVFLGTSSGVPTLNRGVSATALALRLPLESSAEETGRRKGKKRDELGRRVWWLVDCGEGTQQQILRHNAGKTPDGGNQPQNNTKPRLKIPFDAITRVFITHLHGDHCFGLPGLLAMRSMKSGGKTLPPVEVCGPLGVKELVDTSLRLSESFLPFEIRFTELPREEDAPSRVVFGGQDAWADDDNSATAAPHKDAEESDDSTESAVTVIAGRLKHRVPCWGYIFSEKPGSRPGEFSARIAQEKFGVGRGPLLGLLAKGQPVCVDGKTILREQCLTAPDRPRVVVVLGDTSESSSILHGLTLTPPHSSSSSPATTRVIDLLVHESTFDKSMYEKALATGHSTSEMAGQFAEQMAQTAGFSLRCLAITHFSQRYASGDDDSSGATKAPSDPTLKTLGKEAKEACPSVDEVVVAREFEQVAL